MNLKLIATLSTEEVKYNAICNLRRVNSIPVDTEIEMVVTDRDVFAPPMDATKLQNLNDLLKMIQDRSQNKIGMIKAYRAVTRVGLKEAKDAIEAVVPFSPIYR